MERPERIFFEPQTGIVKSEPIRSNFYVFRLESKHLAKVELAVSKAMLQDEGFVYSMEFIEWLHENDTKWDQRTGLAVPFKEREY
jgi:hypothetical protein